MPYESANKDGRRKLSGARENEVVLLGNSCWSALPEDGAESSVVDTFLVPHLPTFLRLFGRLPDLHRLHGGWFASNDIVARRLGKTFPRRVIPSNWWCACKWIFFQYALPYQELCGAFPHRPLHCGPGRVSVHALPSKHNSIKKPALRPVFCGVDILLSTH